MSWARRKKTTYISIIFLFFLIIFLIFVVVFFSKTATCSDNIQNQEEVGIDCGGPCSNLCRAEYSDPNILWVRWSKVLISGTYNVLAYVENPNIESGSYNVPYSFKIYDKLGVLLFEKYGSTYIPPSKNFAVFEDGINIGDKVPFRIDFKFTSSSTWQNIESKELQISSNAAISKEDSKPRVDASLTNKTLKPIYNIEVIAILYDSDGNTIAFSRSKVDKIDGEGIEKVTFTWPESFAKKVYKVETVSKVLGN